MYILLVYQIFEQVGGFVNCFSHSTLHSLTLFTTSKEGLPVFTTSKEGRDKTGSLSEISGNISIKQMIHTLSNNWLIHDFCVWINKIFGDTCVTTIF